MVPEVYASMAIEKGQLEQQIKDLKTKLQEQDKLVASMRGQSLKVSDFEKRISALERSLQYVRKENEANKSEKARALSERDVALKLNSQLRDEVNGFDKQVQQKDLKIEELQRDINSTRYEIEDAKRKLGERDSYARKLEERAPKTNQNNINVLVKENNRLKGEVNDLSGTKTKQSNEINSLNIEIANLKSEASSLRENLNTSWRQANELKDELGSLKEKHERTQKQAAEFQNEVSSLRGSLNTSRRQANEFKDELGSLKEKNERTQKQATEFQNEVSSLRASLNTSQRQEDKLKDELGSLHQKLERTQKEAEFKNEENINHFKRQNASLKKDVDGLMEEVKGYQTEIRELRQLNSEQEKTIKAQQIDNAFEKENMRLKEEATQLSEASKKQKEEIGALNSEMDQLTRELANLRGRGNLVSSSSLSPPSASSSVSSPLSSQIQANSLLTEVDLTGSANPSITEHLIQQAAKLESYGTLSLAKKYYSIILNEVDEIGYYHRQANKSLSSIREKQRLARKTEAENMAKEIRTKLPAQASTLDAQMKAELEKERTKFEERIREIELQSQMDIEYAQKLKEWETKLPTEKTDKKDHELLDSVRKASGMVAEDWLDYNHKMAKAEDARDKLEKSEKELKEKEERLNLYIGLVEQMIGNQQFNDLLHAIQDYTGRVRQTKIKCFISYAWQPQDNARLQAKLVKMKEDLERTGVEVLLDIHNMEGDIDRYMADGIQSSNFVILICTPRFKQRVEEKSATPNNLQKEYQAALLRQAQNPKFIIPIMLEGDHSSSITPEIANILWTDFVDPAKYFKSMVNLEPKGLIPKIFGLDGDRSYEFMVKGFHALLMSQKKQ